MKFIEMKYSPGLTGVRTRRRYGRDDMRYEQIFYPYIIYIPLRNEFVTEK